MQALRHLADRRRECDAAGSHSRLGGGSGRPQPGQAVAHGPGGGGRRAWDASRAPLWVFARVDPCMCYIWKVRDFVEIVSRYVGMMMTYAHASMLVGASGCCGVRGTKLRTSILLWQ
mgnify:CR=1 FL=1